MRSLPLVLCAVLATVGLAQAPSSPDLPPQTLSLENLSESRSNNGWQRATDWEHGDIDLAFDVMLTKGATSAVYLMSRYAVQLTDSWGSRVPTVNDLGAIAAIPPRQNASRAPGLWQHVEIVFRAPRFVGLEKAANARFVSVKINGITVHENVEVIRPAGTSTLVDERANGPLMFLSQRGPIALRNIRYKRYTGAAKLSGLRYGVYEGETMDSSYIATHTPTREGDAAAITLEPVAAQDKFAMAYSGTLSIPTAGRYRFALNLGWIGGDSATRGTRVGGGELLIDGKPVVLHTGAGRSSYGDVDLTIGQHAFRLTFYKNRPSFNRRDVAVWVEGPGVERQALHAENAANAFGTPTNPIIVEPQMEPVVLRSFVRHRDTKRVIVASVADPLGVHYSYDLAQGSPLFVWRGPFLETTQMWHERGENQTAEPLGSAITLPGTPALAFLTNENAAWPDSVDERQFRRDGYQLDNSGHPTFLYRVRDVAVEDEIRPTDDGLSLKRSLRLRGNVTGLYVQLAQADHIVRERDGSYVVGDRSMYITVPEPVRPTIRRINTSDELIVPVRFERGEAAITYSIIW